jgi:hypothetical protein
MYFYKPGVSGGVIICKTKSAGHDLSCHTGRLLCLHDDYGYQICSCGERNARVSRSLPTMDGEDNGRVNRRDSDTRSGAVGDVTLLSDRSCGSGRRAYRG